jgi:hypothetical protein
MDEFERSIEAMGTRWPSPVVARKAIKEFSGGILSAKTMANMDSLGTGPEGRFLMMNQTCYPVESLVAWLKTKSASSWAERKSAEV